MIDSSSTCSSNAVNSIDSSIGLYIIYYSNNQTIYKIWEWYNLYLHIKQVYAISSNNNWMSILASLFWNFVLNQSIVIDNTHIVWTLANTWDPQQMEAYEICFTNGPSIGPGPFGLRVQRLPSPISHLPSPVSRLLPPGLAPQIELTRSQSASQSAQLHAHVSVANNNNNKLGAMPTSGRSGPRHRLIIMMTFTFQLTKNNIIAAVKLYNYTQTAHTHTDTDTLALKHTHTHVCV